MYIIAQTPIDLIVFKVLKSQTRKVISMSLSVDSELFAQGVIGLELTSKRDFTKCLSQCFIMVLTFVKYTRQYFVGLTISFWKEMFEVLKKQILLQNFSVALEVMIWLLVELVPEPSATEYINGLLVLEVL